MKRRPLFTLLVIALFAIGIGTNAVLFSVLDATVIEATPFPKAEHLFHIACRTADFVQFGGCSVPTAVELRQQGGAVNELTYYSESQNILDYGGEAHFLDTAWVSSSFFTTLQRWPSKGRWFMADDDTGLSNNLVILSDATWLSHFGGRTDIVGLTIFLDKKPFVVIGVMPPGFTFPVSRVEAWVLSPLTVASMEDRSVVGNWDIVARARDNTDLKELQAALGVVAYRVSATSVNSRGADFQTVPLRDVVLERSERRTIWILFLGTVFLLGLVTANLVNLLSARNSFEAAHHLIRKVYGATTGRLFREYVVEHLVLAVPALGSGLIFAYAGLKIMGAMGGMGISRWELATIDSRTIGYAVLLATIVVGLSGIVSFWPFVHSPSTFLHRRSLAGSAPLVRMGSHKVQRGFVIVQLFLAVVLLLTATSAVAALWQLLEVPLGFGSQDLIGVIFEPQSEESDSQFQANSSLFAPLLDDIQSLPGVSGAAISSFSPFGGGFMASFAVYNKGQWVWTRPVVEKEVISPSYFDVMKLPLLRGRTFTTGDTRSAPCVAIVNELFANSFLGLRNAIGGIVSGNGKTGESARKCAIVGVVGNVRDLALERNPAPEIYFSDLQIPSTDQAIVVRAGMHSAGFIALLRAVVRKREPNRGVVQISTLRSSILDATRQPRVTAFEVSFFAMTAYIVCLLGVFAIANYFVGERQSEIGIRLALGAQRVSILKMMVGQFAGLVTLGVALGALLAYLLNHIISARIGVIPGIHTQVSLVTVVFLWSSALLACVYPIWILRTDDLSSLLRSE